MSEKAKWFVLGVLVACAMVFFVAQTGVQEPQVGRFTAFVGEARTFLILDTQTGNSNTLSVYSARTDLTVNRWEEQ